MLRFLSILSIVVFALGCTNKNGKPIQVGIEGDSQLFNKSYIKGFPLDSTMTYKPLNISCQKMGNGAYELCYENKKYNSLHFFDFKNEEEIDRIVFPREGPESVSLLQGFYYINADSMLIYDGNRLKLLYLIRDIRSLKSAMTFSDKLDEMETALHIATQNRPISLDEKLHFSAYPITYASEDYNYCSKPISISVSLEKRKSIASFHYPYHYQNKLWGDFAYIIHRSKGHGSFAVQAFAFDHHLHLTDYQGFDSAVLAKSRYWGNASLKPPADPYEERVRVEMVERMFYGAVLHDPFRRVYYRMVLHGLPYKNPDGSINRLEDKPFSVLVMDEQFNVLGEQLFEGGRYAFRCWFVHPDGLFISNANNRNPDLREDWLDFTCFELHL